MHFEAPEDAAGVRLDRFLTEQLEGYSRTRIQAWIRDGRVLVDDNTARPSAKLEGGESIEVEPQELAPLRAVPEAIPLDVLYEDEDCVVVCKPAGMAVHAGAGAAGASGTLVNALLHRFQGKLSSIGGELRPGIVHRLDRFTSGAIVAAKTDRGHQALAEQFERRSVGKTYQAIVHGQVLDPLIETRPAKGRVIKPEATAWVRLESPIGRDTRRRARMAVGGGGRPAITDYRPLRSNLRYSLLEVRIHTGRTHQIRVHLSWIGRPVVGDRLYGAASPDDGVEQPDRYYLHAALLRFRSPSTGEEVSVVAPTDADWNQRLTALEL
ncbi:MAG: RluA family pseudouridine synthase [Acidobacteria bacterium]|nr:RluA family pseudouridine synthase [Acidobacteriota bacterium]